MAAVESSWPLFVQDGAYFSDTIHDPGAIEARQIDKAWDMRDSDVIVATFPKSGTLWMMNMISKMYPDLNMYLDGTARAVRLGFVYERSDDVVEGLYGKHVGNVKQRLREMPSPRLLACHLHSQHFHSSWRNGNRQCKIIYITRNPKDVCVSFYYFMKAVKFTQMRLTWDEWVHAFVEGKVWLGPWLQHVTSWRQYGLSDNVLHLSYEDMKEDLKSTISRVSEFIGRPLAPEHIDKVAERCSAASMKKEGDDNSTWAVTNESNFEEGAQYIRKGQVGNWKEHFTVAQNEWFDQRITAECSKRGLTIRHEL
ncbi:sulfotransferase 2A1-like [Ptychodera flava]|uniref:sulfotransferase 2A1-like n=1 Tax=Ptychodera flava TaxID=63121 RepID=UPI00396A9401